MRWRGQEIRTKLQLKVEMLIPQLYEVDCILFKEVHLPAFPETIRIKKASTSRTRGKTKSPPKKGVKVVNIALPQVKEPKTPMVTSKVRFGDKKKKTGGFDTAVGHNAAKSLLKLPPKMSGIFMPNDVKDEFLPEHKPRPTPLFRKKPLGRASKKDDISEFQHAINLLNPNLQTHPLKRRH